MHESLFTHSFSAGWRNPSGWGLTDPRGRNTPKARVSFGSGLEANAVTVLDHYIDDGAYLTRTRSPFTAQINTRDLSGYNGNYLERTYKYDWPGEATGDYEDVGDIVSVEEQDGNPTVWVEAVQP